MVENGANGISDIEGKAARVAASECGQRVSFNSGKCYRRNQFSVSESDIINVLDERDHPSSRSADSIM
jgi:hypothetical protein